MSKRAFEGKAKALTHSTASLVCIVGKGLHPTSPEGREREVHDSTDTLRDETFSDLRRATPIANLKLRHGPVDSVQSRGADDKVCAPGE